MAKKDRQKRSARQARQRQRAELEAARATSGQSTSQSDAKSSRSGIKKSDAQAPKKSKDAKPKTGKDGKPKKKGPIVRMKGYFRDVKTEMHQVVWPSRNELRNYSVAVVAMLIVFGVCVWLVDTGFVQGLVALTGLRG